ncbi:zinc-binding dehydrogenase [Phytoactinopolyspora endophytica]|uniref:zinc-binding dehydrogenase n=1 Tax=Phytoactinopolyspora endophytica TaxID=1642495 RepID=UPI00101D3E8C|nr:zinc-binding dehydrogenase [Phytoactinopolyspora endophytica]
MRAAILPAVDGVITVRDVPKPQPQRGEVLVEVAACGVCHTDLHVIRGEVAFPTPCVLGHEITGRVAQLGDGVGGGNSDAGSGAGGGTRGHGLEIGTPVVCGFIMPCGTCRHCVRGWDDLCETFFTYNRLAGTLYDGTSRLVDDDGSSLAMYSMAGLAEYSVVPATDVFPMPDSIDVHDGAILGCSVFTSYGAVKNVAGVVPSDTVAVVAVGGIGLNIVQVAAAFGARTIIAVDLSEEKLALAKELGATHIVNAGDTDAVAAIRDLTGGRGVDVAFEALGSAPTVETAIGAVDDGGRVVLVGIAPAGVTAKLDIAHVVRRKIRVMGSYGARTRTDMPDLLALVGAGKIRLDRLITDRLTLDDVDDAYRRLGRREIVGRAIIELNPSEV